MVQLTQELLHAVSELELKTRSRVTALLAGNYRTAFRGSGMQFKEFRHYEPGDDIRHMSWAVTARTGRSTVKTFEEERELNVIVMVDVSGSSLLGQPAKRKLDMYAELVALIGFSAHKSGDQVGLLLFDDGPATYLPPKRTRSQVMMSIAYLLSHQTRGKKSDFAAALTYLHSVLKQRSLIIAISDFWVPPFEMELTQLSKRNEILLLHCYDDLERGFGLSGVYPICDPETDELLLLDGNSKMVRQALAASHMQLTNNIEALCKKTNTDYLTLSVEDDYLQRLVNYFRLRGPSRL